MDPPPPSLSATTTTNQTNHPDSMESSPWSDEVLPPVSGVKLRLMCSYNGHIMPRPHNKSLCYIGGDTRIVVVDRHFSWKELCTRLSHTILHGRPFTLKYQLPNEDLDNLITVTNDEDFNNMIEEYDRLIASSASPLKPSFSILRVFLFFTKPESRVSMGSLIDDAKSKTWFVDALNNSGILSRVVSDSATVDRFVNLDGVIVTPSASSNNLEAQSQAEGDSNNKVKNFHDVENSSSNDSSSPSMANLPPIRVCVDENGSTSSRLQQEQMVVVSSTVTMPTIPAAMVTTTEHMNRVVSDDERSDHGAPIGFRKPPLPLQLVQPRTIGGLSLTSPDSVASDSSAASTNSFSKDVYYQVQAAQIDNKATTLPNAKSEISDHIQQQHQQQQFVHANTHSIHYPTTKVSVSSYYPVYAPPSQQQLHHPIGQQQYPIYVMPVGPTQPYNMAYKDGTPPIYPTKSVTPTIPEVTPSVYKAPMASNPAFVPMPSNQFQKQYAGLPQVHHHPPQPIAVTSSVATSYGYEYGGTVQDQAYYTQQQTTAPLPTQYHSMIQSAAAAGLYDASKQFPANNTHQQSNRTSQPV